MKDLKADIFKMLMQYSAHNPDVQLGALLTEINGGKEVIKYLPDSTLHKKLLYRMNKIQKQKEDN